MVLLNYQNFIEMTSNMIYIVAIGGIWIHRAPPPSLFRYPWKFSIGRHSIILMQGLSQLGRRANISAKLPAVFVGFLNFLLFSFRLRVASYIFFCKFPSNDCNYSNQKKFKKHIYINCQLTTVALMCTGFVFTNDYYEIFLKKFTQYSPQSQFFWTNQKGVN